MTTLKRVATRWQIVALALNDVVGSGVYLLPAAAAALLGPLSLAAVVAAGFAVLLIVLCFAEAASHFEEPGSAYLYAREAFGPLVGFEVGWMAWLARVASVASLSVGFAQALSFLIPATAHGLGRGLIAKVYRYTTTWDRLRYRWMRHRAEQERSALERFADLGLPAPRFVGVAELRQGRSVVGGGGGSSAGATYSLGATVGQAVAGSAQGAVHGLCAGYWCGLEGYRVFVPLVMRE